MVQAIDYRLHHLLQLLEVEQQTGLVKFLTLQGNADLVIVPMRVLTFAAIIPQKVAGSKGVFNRDLIHASSEFTRIQARFELYREPFIVNRRAGRRSRSPPIAPDPTPSRYKQHRQFRISRSATRERWP